MPSLEESASRSHRRDADAEYYYRRSVSPRELLPAIAIGIGAGLFAFYLMRLLLQRTPFRVQRSTRHDVQARPSARSARA